MLPILAIAANQITITDGETTPTECSEQNPLLLKKIRYEPPSESLLLVLDDKNRIIANLKKQLQNQKAQLSFYIKREINKDKIEELSESCTPQASEESLPVNLALNKFCRQAGIKTKLSQLHERMDRLDYKISTLLKDQEFVLRKIVNKLCEFVKCQDSSRAIDFQAEFGSFVTDPLHIDLFSKLLSATIGLSRKLNGFKISCDRLLAVEEERNCIVEQVYAMPAEERINCNYLLGIQMEKAQLENEIRRISRHQAASRHRIKELNVIEKILHNLQWELNSSFLKNEESCISKMVKKINSEARVLLEMTKEQKRRFECEFSKTKCPDSNRILVYIRAASDGDKMDKKELERRGIKTEDELRCFEMVKGEINAIKKKVQYDAEKENKKLHEECEKLKGKITQVLLENSRTKVTNSALKQELEELKLERKSRLQTLQQERDAYKCQVEDLQAIREAYAQLVDKQPNTTQMERDFFEQISDRDERILGLEYRLSEQNQEMEKLRTKIFNQKDQIAVLNRFINLTRPNTPRDTNISEKVVLQSDPNCNNKIFPKSSSTSRSTITSPNKSKSKKMENTLPRYRPNYTKKVPKGKPKYHAFPSVLKKKFYKHKNSGDHTPETLSRSEEEESITCLKIYSQRKEKTSDSLKTVVTSGEINGNGTMEKSSVFSMEIKFASNDVDNGLSEYDEFELFKDCSMESILLKNYYEKMSRSSGFLNGKLNV